MGRSLLFGLLTAPAVAAAAFLVSLIGLESGLTNPSLGNGTAILVVLGGPLALLVGSAGEAIAFSVIGILFVLAAAYRRRVFIIGIVAALIIGAISTIAIPPAEPFLTSLIFAFGAVAATIAVFLAYDLLAATVALFGGALLVYALPVLSVSRGDFFQNYSLTLAAPPAILFVFAIAALMTRREVVYTYEDLAPHVKRIVERERVKAEIDAANRIQAALLPASSPDVSGASVASHYRAATEIGGDYFDFLPQQNGQMGIAFGDVSGHGLTSGIVMAMAKSALLVQLNTDSSPRTVMNVLNDIVIRTAPRRILMTFFFGLLDPRAHTLRFSSAGHLDPYVYRASTGKLEALSSWGFPLGVRRREGFREHMVQFSAGDRLRRVDHLVGEAVDGRRLGEAGAEVVGVVVGDAAQVEVAQALAQAVRAGEGVLGAHALVVEQPQQRGIAVVAQVLVVVRAARERALALEALHHAHEPPLEVAPVEMNHGKCEVRSSKDEVEIPKTEGVGWKLANYGSNFALRTSPFELLSTASSKAFSIACFSSQGTKAWRKALRVRARSRPASRPQWWWTRHSSSVTDVRLKRRLSVLIVTGTPAST